MSKIIASIPCCTDLFERKGKIYTFLNPVSYLEAVKNKELFESFDGIFVDGKFLASTIRLFYHKRVERCSFDMTALAPVFFDYCEAHDKSIYLVAGTQKEVDRAAELFCEYWPNLKFAKSRNGYFGNEQEMNDEIQKIVNLNPDYVICGMGAVRQEMFLRNLKAAGYQGIAFTCGGFISQTSKADITYYPKFFDKLNLRFVYRMLREKHTRKRYMRSLFFFPVKFVEEWIISLGKDKTAKNAA